MKHITEVLLGLARKHGKDWPEHVPDDVIRIDLEASSPLSFTDKFIELFNLDDVHSGTLKCDWYYDGDVLYIKKEG